MIHIIVFSTGLGFQVLDWASYDQGFQTVVVLQSQSHWLLPGSCASPLLSLWGWWWSRTRLLLTYIVPFTNLWTYVRGGVGLFGDVTWDHCHGPSRCWHCPHWCLRAGCDFPDWFRCGWCSFFCCVQVVQGWGKLGWGELWPCRRSWSLVGLEGGGWFKEFLVS